jgi:hypothetical protein
MSAEAKAESERLVQKAMAEMPLNELRNARGLSQKMLAEANFSQLDQETVEP